MTSRICSKSYHPAASFFAFTLKRQIGITLLVTAFMLLICPGILWQQVYGIGSGSYSLDSELSVWSVEIFLVSLLLGIILLCYNHTHLFSKKSADMYYSLPVKRDTMLLVRFGASVVGAVFAMTASFSGLTLINFMPYVRGIDLVQMLKLYALCLMLLLLCMSTVLIFIVNSGSVFHFIFSILVVCVGIPLICLIGFGWYDNAAQGVATNEMWLRYVSPFVYAVGCLVGQEEGLRQGKVLIDAVTLFISVGGTLLFAALSFLMNHRRKTEKAGDSFVYSAMPVLIAVIASALGGYLVGAIFQLDWGAHDLSFWFFFTVGAALVAVAVGAIVSKGFRKIWRWFICAAVATVLMLSVFLVSDQMGDKAFRKIPQADEIQSVTLQGTYCSPTVRLTEDLELVTKLHAHMIAIKSGEKEPYEFVESFTKEDGITIAGSTYITTELLSSDFSFTYELKNGKTVSRTYWIRDYEGLCMLLDIVQTEEYAAAWENDLNMTGLDKLHLNYYNHAAEESDVTLVTQEQAKELLRTYGRDLQMAEDAALLYDGEMITFELAGRNGHLYLAVHPEFFNTLALLEELLK